MAEVSPMKTIKGHNREMYSKGTGSIPAGFVRPQRWKGAALICEPNLDEPECLVDVD
jgi:hypothetical protein